MNPTKTGLRKTADAHLTSLAVLVPATAVLLAARDRTSARMRGQGHDAGASVVEWVVITAVLVTIALGVALILTGKFNGKANDLDLTTP